MMVSQAFMGRAAVAASLVALMAGAPALAQNVVVRGARTVDSEQIKSYFAGKDAAAGLADLKASGLVTSATAKRQGASLVVTVTEAQGGVQINRVAFEGNSKMKSAQLEPEMQLKSRGRFIPTTAQADVERIKAIYRRNGREANVTYRTVNLPNGRIDVVYTIDEGVKVGVRNIRFQGNGAYSESKLRGLMQTTEMNMFSWLKTSDVYDADRIAQDQELIRRYYTRNGYADFRIDRTDVQYLPGQGYDITMYVSEGPRYRVGNVSVDSRLSGVDSASLSRLVKVGSGDVYDGTAVERSLEDMSREATRRGYAFAQVRPRGTRNPATGNIDLALTVDDGPRLYVERINVRGNTRTRDYVIRREFDLGEGDPYNRILLDQAERRLNGLGFFKKVRITNEPGSSPDRVVVNVDVEDQSTGSFAISGGYSTSDGFLGELSVSESNFLGRGQYVRVAISEGQKSRGVEFNFTEPYFLDYRLAAGFDVFHKQTDDSKYSRYENWVTGGTVRFGVPLTEQLTFSPRYSLFNSKIKVPNTSAKPFDDCSVPIVGTTPGTGGLAPALSSTYNCLSNGEASLAIKESRGSRLTSMPGYSLTYNTLDNTRNPTRGLFAEVRQDLAGLGGDSRFLRTSGDLRVYRELFDDVVGFVRLQGGHVMGFGGKKLRIVDNYNLGPSLVRGFAPGGIGPRDISDPTDTQSNPLGGTTYFGGSVEVQFPFFGMPREVGLKGAIFADAGTLFGYKGETNFNKLLGLPAGTPCSATGVAPNYTLGNCVTVWDDKKIRSSVGASLIWASPLGPIRFDWAYPISSGKYDVKQFFRFSGGTSF